MKPNKPLGILYAVLATLAAAAISHAQSVTLPTEYSVSYYFQHGNTYLTAGTPIGTWLQSGKLTGRWDLFGGSNVRTGDTIAGTALTLDYRLLPNFCLFGDLGVNQQLKSFQIQDLGLIQLGFGGGFQYRFSTAKASVALTSKKSAEHEVVISSLAKP